MAKVAVLLATYNGEKYIKELLESLDNQTMQDFHCYIHDDGSTDNTIKIVSEYIENKKKFSMINGNATGSSTNNFIFLLQNVLDEQYFMFCDQDDVWDEDKIQVSLMEIDKLEKEKPLLAFSDLRVVDECLNIIDDSYMHYSNRNPYDIKITNLLRKNVAPGCVMIMNRNLYNIVMDNLHVLKEAMFDWGIILLAEIYGSIAYYDKATISYRQHTSNVVGAKKETGISSILSDIIKTVCGKKRKYIKESINLERNLARQIIIKMDSSHYLYNFLNELSQIENKKKISRIRFYISNEMVSIKTKSVLRLLYV